MLEAAGAPAVTQPNPAARRLRAGPWPRRPRRLPPKGEPRITRFVASQITTPHWYDIGAARRDFGYAPAVSIDEGLARLRSARA